MPTQGTSRLECIWDSGGDKDTRLGMSRKRLREKQKKGKSTKVCSLEHTAVVVADQS